MDDRGPVLGRDPRREDRIGFEASAATADAGAEVLVSADAAMRSYDIEVLWWPKRVTSR